MHVSISYMHMYMFKHYAGEFIRYSYAGVVQAAEQVCVVMLSSTFTNVLDLFVNQTLPDFTSELRRDATTTQCLQLLKTQFQEHD